MMGKARIVIATRNRGKIREYQAMLANLNNIEVELLSLDEAGVNFDVEETGNSFVENATLKATAYCVTSGLCTLADDSGLEVDALGGEPGVFSSRYAGPDADDAERVRFLLSKLAHVPQGQRSARFRCAIALATPAKAAQIAEGACEGEITFAPRGRHGFGYDPVFYLPDLKRTMAELSPDEKNQISHRARALQTMRPLLIASLREGKCGA